MKKVSKPVIVLFFLIGITFQSCVDIPKDFVAPSYNIQVAFPISDSLYTLNDILRNDSTIVSSKNPNSMGLLYYVQKNKVRPFYVDNHLSINGFSTSVKQKIGSVKINDVTPISTTLKIEDWVPGALSGTTVIFPKDSIQFTRSFDQIKQFASVTLDGGTLELKLINRLPVYTELRGITIKNATDNTIIAQKPSTEPVSILPMDSTTVSFDLSGKTISNSLVLESKIYTPGSNSQFVTLPQNAGTVIDAEFKNLTISKVTAILPPQKEFKIDNSVMIDDSTKIEKAIFEKGNFNIAFNNYLDVDITLKLTLKNLFKPDGSPFSATISLNRNELNKVINVASLKGWSIQTLTQGTLTNKLNYIASISTSATTDPRTLSKNDSVSVKIKFGNIIFSSVKGLIKPTKFNIAKTNFDLNLGNFKDKFSFDSLKLNNPSILLGLNSSINMGIELKGKMEASNNSQQRSLNVDLNIPPKSSKIFDLKNYGFVDFINSFTGSIPNKFTFSGQAIINPDYLQGSVAKSDSVSGDMDIQIPLDVGIAGGTFVDTFKVDSINISDKDINSINSLTLTIEMINKIPVQLSFKGSVLDKQGNQLVAIPPSYNAKKEIIIEAPTVDQNGNVVSPAVTKQNIELRGADAQTFLHNRRLSVIIKLITPPPDSNIPVKFKTTGSIFLKLYGQANYKLNND